jgi:hypothetical protein
LKSKELKRTESRPKVWDILSPAKIAQRLESRIPSPGNRNNTTSNSERGSRERERERERETAAQTGSKVKRQSKRTNELQKRISERGREEGDHISQEESVKMRAVDE